MKQTDLNIGLSLEKIKKIDDYESQAWKVYLAALEYISLGWYVLPISRNGKTLPRRSEGYSINYGHAAKKKKVIDKWFNPESGEFKGWNIGIATGKTDGVFAIDIDKHSADDGFINLARLEKEHGELPGGPIQRTPNGGEHRLFLWQENAASSTNKIAKAIDTRGGTDNACKGHIVVWPSIVNEKQYEWTHGGELPYIPEWVMQRMGETWNPPKYSNRGNENVGEDDLEQKIPAEQIQRMLTEIDPNELSYDDWLRVGMSVKSQYPDASGLKIWDEWSQKGERYKKGECQIRWNGFSDCGAVRAGTLFYFAKQGGWEKDKILGDVGGNRYDNLVAEMNQTYCIVTVGGKIRILREKDIADNPMSMHYDLMDKDSFRTLLQNEQMMIVDGRGNPKMVSVADIWLAHSDRRTYPNGIGLFPNMKTPNGYYNTWNGFSIEPREGKCELFLNHLRQVICNNDESKYEWVLDWLADLIQEPSKPKGCAIVMRGEEGAGKGIFANTIGEMFGPHFRHLIDDNHLTSNFNAHLLDAIVVFADEITWGGNKKTSGKLKGMVTERYLVGERKGIDAISYQNMIHMLIASNSEWVIPAGGNSRRWFVVDVEESYLGDVDYFDAIEHELNNGGREALLHFLHNREITHNLRRAPETKALKEQRALNVESDTIISWWIESLAIGELDTPDEKEVKIGDDHSGWPTYCNKMLLFKEYETWCATKNIKARIFNIFCKETKKLGISTAKVTINKERHYVFKIPKIEEAKKIVGVKFGDLFDEGEDND